MRRVFLFVLLCCCRARKNTTEYILSSGLLDLIDSDLAFLDDLRLKLTVAVTRDGYLALAVVNDFEHLLDGSGKETIKLLLDIACGLAIRHKHPVEFHFFLAESVVRLFHGFSP